MHFIPQDERFAQDRTTFYIPEANMPGFEAAIAKLSKRAKRLTGQEITPVVIGYETKTLHRYTEDGRQTKDTYDIRVFQVYLSAENPKLDGWQFVARIDHSNETGNIIRSVPNIAVEIPDLYRTAKPNCQHCSKARLRRDTFVAYNEVENRFMQIGSNCLADFLGHDVMRFARIAEYLGYAMETAQAAEYEEDRDYGGYIANRKYIPMEEFLCHAAAMVRVSGWTSGGAAYQREDLTATKTAAMKNMFDRPSPRENWKPEPILDVDRALAAEALEWARGFEAKDTLTDYEHNVLVIANAAMIEQRSTGIAASIVGVFHTRTEKGKQEAEQKRIEAEARAAFGDIVAKATHLGKPEEKMKNIKGRVLMRRQTEFSVMFKMLTEDNKHVLTWFSTGQFDAKVGDSVLITSLTIRQHGEYQGAKETKIHRCRAKVLEAA